ncbi:MAG TPA: hypothetical protein VFB50_01435 [Chloroflexota bacterium]|nr:hypothetical protein [Chloroflexota bacterium]
MPYPLRESITLDGMDLTLYQFSAPGQRRQQQQVDQETNVVQISGEPLDVSEEPLVMDTFHLGFGYSWRLLAGTYAYAENADCRFPRLVLPGPLVTEVTITGANGPPRCGQDYQGNFLVGAGRYIYSVPGGTGTPTQVFDVGAANVAWSMDTFIGNLYVGTSAGQLSTSPPGPLVRNASGTWTGGGPNRKSIAHAWYQSSATGTFGAWQLIGQDSLSSVSNVAADPMVAGNWGASISVGDTTYAINSLVSDQGHVYVAKTNGLHDVDGATGYTPNLMPFYESAVDDDNGVASVCANGSIFVNDISGLFRLDTSSGSTTGRITTVTPGHGLPNETPIRGKIQAMTSYGAWVIASVYNGQDSYIMWGRDIRQGDAGTSPFGYGAGYGPSPQAIGPSPMLWHGALIKLPGEMCRMLAVSGLTSPPRLWLGSWNPTNTSAHLRWCTIPRTENPMQDPEMTFATSWEVHIPGEDWQHPVTTKDLLQIDVQADGLLAGQTTIDFSVSADGGSLQAFGTAHDSPQSTLVGATDFFGRRIALCMDGTNLSTAPPIVRALMLRAQLRPALRRIRTYEVLFGEGNVDRFGGRDISRPISDYWKLEPLQWGGRVKLRDEYGEGYDVLVLPPIERRVIHLGGESGKGTAEPVIVATLTLKLLAADPPISVTWPAAHWDDGTSKYDTDVHWGSP